jgi:hypothetical protein
MRLFKCYSKLDNTANSGACFYFSSIVPSIAISCEAVGGSIGFQHPTLALFCNASGQGATGYYLYHVSTIVNCTSDGNKIYAGAFRNITILNTIISNSAVGIQKYDNTYGKYNLYTDFINYYNNTKDFSTDNGTTEDNTQKQYNSYDIDPQYVDSANKNFMVGTNMRSKGMLMPIESITQSFIDLGSAQRQEKKRDVSFE